MRPAGRPMFAKDADLTVHWPGVRSCWEEDWQPEHDEEEADVVTQEHGPIV